MILSNASLGVDTVMAVRLAGIVLAILLQRRTELVRRIVFGSAALASTLTGLIAVAVLRSGDVWQGVFLVHRASGLSLVYAIDPLSAWFLLVLSAIAVPIAMFSIGYVRHPPLGGRSAFVGIAFTVLLCSVELVFMAADAIAFLFAWELMTLATAALVATQHEVADTRRAAYLYLVMSHVATGALIGAFFILASASGSVSFSALLAGDVLSGPVRDTVFLLFLLGFGVKAGIIPLHIWLPEAHPAAPSSISALMSGVLIKTGIYGIVRFCAFGLGNPPLSWGVLVLLMGAVSAVLGVLYALVQHDLKRLLAYHSIENIGIILLGVGAGMIAVADGQQTLAALGIAAGLFHVLNHAVFKALLFLGAGSVVTATGTRQIEALGGLLRGMPWTGVCFLIGAVAISGLPPLNGFASEWLAFQALFQGFPASTEPVIHLLFPIAAALLALTGALAAACFVKAFGVGFLALPRSVAAATAREVPWSMCAPQVVLAALCVWLGAFPGAVLSALHTVLLSLPGLRPAPDTIRGPLSMAATSEPSSAVTPMALALALLGGLGVAVLTVAVFRLRGRTPALRSHETPATRPAVVNGISKAEVMAGDRIRRAPTWGCGGLLGAHAEYTAAAFSKPLMMIFRAVYRPTREVEALAKVSPYFPQEVRYHLHIEPTFERYVYGPLTEAVFRVAARLKILQAGSLHAYLGYVIVLVLSLVLMIWWTR
jgi:hydrogenase-4 component B